MKRRLARLYPLHFVTLIAVAILQVIYTKLSGKPFVYPFNDIKHFILNLFFASNWGFENGHSFNGPIWSVSIEILAYVAFFTICFLNSRAKWVTLLMVGSFCMAAISFRMTGSIVSKSLSCFFAGAALYQILNSALGFKKALLPVVLILIGIYRVWGLGKVHRALEVAGLPHGSLGPLIIALFIAFEINFLSNVPKKLHSVFDFIGSLSYSSYLVHFPIQLLMIVVSTAANGIIPFEKNYVLFVYVLGVLITSAISALFFEKTAKNFVLSLAYRPISRESSISSKLT